MLITDSGIVIRVHATAINHVGRGSQGVRIMRLGEEDKVVSVAVVDKYDEVDELTDEANIEQDNENITNEE